MNKYKIFLELLLKRAKNRIIINLMERIEVFCIVMILFFSLFGGAIFMGQLFNNMEITEEAFNRIYYAIIIPSVLPFLFIEARSKDEKNKDYTIDVLFGHKTYIILKEIIKFVSASIIAALYLRYMISRFNVLSINKLFLFWLSYLLILVALSKILSLLFSFILSRSKVVLKKFKFEDLKKLGFTIFLLIGIVSPIKNVIQNSWKIDLSIKVIAVAFVLASVISFIAIVINIVLCTKVNNIEKIYQKQRIFMNSGNPYVEIAFINSKSYLLFVTILTLFIHALNFVVKTSLVMNNLLQILIMIGIPTFIIEKLDKKQLNVLSNLRASLYKYILSLEGIFLIISFNVISISIVISVFAGDTTFSELITALDYKSYMFSIFIATNISVILRMLFGRSLDGIMKNIVIFVSFILAYIMIPTISAQIQGIFFDSFLITRGSLAVLIFLIKSIMVTKYELCE